MSIFSPTLREDIDLLSLDEKQSLLHGFWPPLKAQPDVTLDENLEQYLDFLCEELVKCEQRKDDFAAQTFKSLLQIVDALRSGGDKRAIASSLHANYLNVSQDSVIRSMELAARLWLTVNIRSPLSDIAPTSLDGMALPWTETVDLKTVIRNHFDKFAEVDAGKFNPRSFNSWLSIPYLSETRGIHVKWTDNLLDHLKLETNTVSVYRHKICLELHLRRDSFNTLSETVVMEAIDTLNLLFPQDAETKTFLHQEKQVFYTVGNCGREVVVDISRYKKWRSRLLALSHILDRKPRTLQRFNITRRINEKRFAFWSQACSIAIALVGIVVATVGIIVATLAIVVGTVYAAKQYGIAVKQYELSVAQACLVPNAENVLPQYCN